MASKEGASAEGLFTKPGQRFLTPSPGAGMRVFYETLFKEKPSSMMALIWCIENGILDAAEAEKLMTAYAKAKAAQKTR